nr:YqaJ viral recombinase family protein [Escherichia coli]
MTPDIILQRTGIDVRAVEQGDDAWHKLRLGVITASEVHNVIAKPRSGKKWPDMKMSYFHTLLAEVCTGVAPEVNAKALAWGKQYENDARTLFEFTSGVNVTEACIAALQSPLHTVQVSAGDGITEERKCHSSAEMKYGMPRIRSRAGNELRNLLAQRTSGKLRSCTTSEKQNSGE